ncbi:hepatocyte cell adhesion molecule-like isoform X1 [Carassius auratus]|uniref:Hepatocyte cell adhesion molecule-like isoform X1 n=1 Tax=Carassius auratus TaxID=7957 RepID=A0A6P6MW03_CARAU|nr:hepatocyte cell adhesion molecule-like isoform X1 [Carassius auratus]
MPLTIFEVFLFFCLCSWSPAGVFGDEVKSVSVTEGDSVSLHTDYTDTLRKGSIEWKFGPKDILIAQINRKDNVSTIFNDSAGGRFRDRLKLDQTGSLIITNTRTTDSGLYKVFSSRRETPLDIFNLTVYAPLSTPNIIRDSLSVQNSSSSSGPASSCVFLCSVVNVDHVTLSWYKGNSLLSSISVSDLSRSLSLHLECLDDFYSCVVNNPIRNQTTHLNTQLCQTCSDSVSLIVWISAAGGFLLIVTTVGIFCICRKYRRTDK